MSFPGKLLLLSVKTQITWTIITLSSIAVILIYIIINLYIYELKEQSLNSSTEYFYSIQKEIFQNIISFQNHFLFNYEDTLKILTCQLVLLLDISNYFTQTFSSSIFNISLHYLNNTNYLNDINDINELNLQIFYINNDNLLTNNEENNDFIKMTFRIVNTFKTLRIPYYGDYQLFDGVIVYLNKTKQIFCLNDSFLKEYVINEIGSYNFNDYYIELTNNIMNSYKLSLEKIINDKSIYPELTLTEEMINMIKYYKINRDIKLFSKYTPYLDYKKEFLHIIKTEDENNEIFVTVKLKSGLIDEIFLKMMEYFNITTLLITPEDNNILNIMTCQALLVKIRFFSSLVNSEKNKKKLNESINEIEKLFIYNNITIDKCLSENEEIDEESYYRNYLFQKNSYFFDLTTIYNSSFIQLSSSNIGSEYMLTRYNYPDLFLVERKRPRYLIPNYLNVYTFMNFYFPYSYTIDKSDYLLLNFYTITSVNWQIWLLIFFIIFFICLKLSENITNPIIKLKKAIEQMSFSDKTIFEYKDDDNINELFAMCKELVNKDEFKKSLNEKSFIDDKKFLEENNDFLNELDNEQRLIKRGINRNIIINNQVIEKNRKINNEENKVSFEKEIIIYKDYKFIPKIRPRNLSRKRPKTINKLIKTKLNVDNTLKLFCRFKTKGDYNINSKLRDNFLRDSFISNKSRRNGRVSFDEAGIKKDKGNKNDNELNVLLYELLFCLGKNMFKTNDKERVARTKYFKPDRSLSSNNDITSYNNSTKTIKKIDYEDYRSKYYNYNGPIFESNDNLDIYEERKPTINFDKRNYEKVLKEQYQIKFEKNNFYHKYLNAKSDWNNKFLKKFRFISDLELDSNSMIEIDDDFSIERKTMKKIGSSKHLIDIDRKSNRTSNKEKNSDKDVNIPVSNNNNLKWSITKNKNRKKASLILRQSIASSSNPFRTDISKKQKRHGLRASISMNMKGQRSRGKTLEKIKRKNFKDLKSNK